MVEKIDTLEQFTEMITSDFPILKEGTTSSDVFAYELKNGTIDKEHYIALCLRAIPKALTIFPEYPSCIKFVRWINNAGILTEEILFSLVELIKNWTEEEYPSRLHERSMVILEIASNAKHIISFEEIVSISPKTTKDNPWWVHTLQYQYEPEKALENLQQMPTKHFAKKVFVYIPMYLKNFSKEQLMEKFERLQLPDTEKGNLLKWLETFAIAKPNGQ